MESNEIKRLKRLLNQIVDTSKYIDSYTMDVLVEDRELFVNIELRGGNVIIAQSGCSYFNALRWAKRTLYLAKGEKI